MRLHRSDCPPLDPRGPRRRWGLGLAGFLLLFLFVFGAQAAESPESMSPAPKSSEDAAAESEEPIKRVVYLPETVRAQLRDEIKEAVLKQAKDEGWAAPNEIPAWTKRFHLMAEARLRWEMLFYDKRNANSVYFPDFNAINSGQGWDALGIDPANDRYINTNQNRRRPRLKARLGVEIDVGQGFGVELAFGTGDGSSPISANQTLGGAPGDFSKLQLWIDRAALTYQPFKGQPVGLMLKGGRLANPFFSTELIWWPDLSIDGLALQAWLDQGPLRLFLNGGGFPFFITGLDSPADRFQKLPSLDKWLVAGQLGAHLRPREGLSFKVAAAYYFFDSIQGRVGNSCNTFLKGVTCDTDLSRPLFAQKGNTYMALRTPSVEALNAEATGFASEYQYFGLAHLFRELAVTARVEISVAPWLMISLDGEAVWNLGFSKARVGTAPVNNFGTCYDEENCPYAGGRSGYFARLSFGSPKMNERWSWSVGVTYRSVESDAVVDAFNDPDFGLGGTNLRGYSVTAGLALADGVIVQAKWFSADSIIGPPYGVDVLHIDVVAKY
jgi:hypothetical protein